MTGYKIPIQKPILLNPMNKFICTSHLPLPSVGLDVSSNELRIEKIWPIKSRQLNRTTLFFITWRRGNFRDVSKQKSWPKNMGIGCELRISTGTCKFVMLFTTKVATKHHSCLQQSLPSFWNFPGWLKTSLLLISNQSKNHVTIFINNSGSLTMIKEAPNLTLLS